ncbi:MAG TPA: PPOX class F420-dependent oxidoreductase [Anaerolineales bacterium]|jgi:pyridoxamine 5'-phosphate oxidase family protein|nr:PPOX class F420-dependent oxidoreductase [Anaerolineae bacterium]HRJ57845.1 PPOX class F420-dependent oxidoreductase [Anaerolineales bacterium]HRK91579.1 PPOX class F420-dependent oxidoreductase [Anaerolineales bacterium]
MFTEKEIAYIHSQHLARLATVSISGQTDVAPVGFRFDGNTFFITGFDITKTFKYKNVKAGNVLVSLVIDDLASVQPWMARGIKIHGTAEIVERDGRASLVIHPKRLWSWGVDDVAFKDGKPLSRKANQA